MSRLFVTSISATGFITDGNSNLVGNARLRQVRVQKNSCHIASSMQHSVQDCHAPYSWEMEDMDSYGPGWSRSLADNSSQNLQSPWKYQSQGKLRASPIWGSLMLYRGGGFVVNLGPDLQNSSRYLKKTQKEKSKISVNTSQPYNHNI